MTDTRAAARRAADFVSSEGDVLARSRARAHVALAPASDTIELLSGSPPGGSSRDGAFVRVADWLRVLGILDDLRALESPLGERACIALTASQRDDGSWSDTGDVAIDERLFTTGMIAGHLAKTPFARDTSLAGAADHLAAAWNPARVEESAWSYIAAFSHCFALVRHEAADDILPWCGRGLERGYRIGGYDAVRTARVFALCRAHALPGAGLGRAELALKLLAEQQPDGGFTPQGDASKRARVAHTLDALVALTHVGGLDTAPADYWR